MSRQNCAFRKLKFSSSVLWRYQKQKNILLFINKHQYSMSLICVTNNNFKNNSILKLSMKWIFNQQKRCFFEENSIEMAIKKKLEQNIAEKGMNDKKNMFFVFNSNHKSEVCSNLLITTNYKNHSNQGDEHPNYKLHISYKDWFYHFHRR